jgi:lipopolysaccharide transport protein LptA
MFALTLVAAAVISAAPHPDAGAPLHNAVISAELGTFEHKRHRGTYTGHVKVLRDTLTLTCDSLEAFFDDDDKVVRTLATGHVVAIDGEREAHSDTADYDNVTGVLVAHGKPWARQGKREVEGEEITFVTGSDTLLVKKARTRAPDEKAPKAGQFITIDADTLVLEQQKAVAVWKGHVKAIRGPTVLTAPELEATWNEAGEITHLTGRGGVDAVEPTRRAHGQHAEFDVEKGILVVTGKPEAQQGNNHLEGRKVTFFPNTDFVSVEDATSVFQVEKKPGSKKP